MIALGLMFLSYLYGRDSALKDCRPMAVSDMRACPAPRASSTTVYP